MQMVVVMALGSDDTSSRGMEMDQNFRPKHYLTEICWLDALIRQNQNIICVVSLIKQMVFG